MHSCIDIAVLSHLSNTEALASLEQSKTSLTEPHLLIERENRHGFTVSLEVCMVCIIQDVESDWFAELGCKLHKSCMAHICSHSKAIKHITKENGEGAYQMLNTQK